MARGGARVGTGPKKGSKFRKTIERELRDEETRSLVLAEAERLREAAKSAGRKRAKDVLDDLMHLGAGMAAFYQPAPPGQPKNKNENEAKFWQAATFARECARDLASYQDPKYKAIAVYAAATPPQEKSPSESKVIAKIGDPARVYRSMIGGVRG